MNIDFLNANCGSGSLPGPRPSQGRLTVCREALAWRTGRTQPPGFAASSTDGRVPQASGFFPAGRKRSSRCRGGRERPGGDRWGDNSGSRSSLCSPVSPVRDSFLAGRARRRPLLRSTTTAGNGTARLCGSTASQPASCNSGALEFAFSISFFDLRSDEATR